jgi:hypothetical protein
MYLLYASIQYFSDFVHRKEYIIFHPLGALHGLISSNLNSENEDEVLTSFPDKRVFFLVLSR